MARTETARTHDTPTATLDRLMTTRELIARTSLSRSTLWRMARSGALPPPVRLTPTRIAWRESQIAAWLDARTPRTPEAA
ncbi:MAG: AlpA family phage regulatory protein [Acidobacteria bacterium]|nr:AlpA family phage regulatory protein [Acidobacteriota bacterium]